MAIEIRHSGFYYYRKKRVGRRVKSEYLGRGDLALLFKNFDKTEREGKQLEAAQERKIRDEMKEIDRALSVLETNINSLVENILISKGFYKTKSREWRYKNEK